MLPAAGAGRGTQRYEGSVRAGHIDGDCTDASESSRPGTDEHGLLRAPEGSR